MAYITSVLGSATHPPLPTHPLLPEVVFALALSLGIGAIAAPTCKDVLELLAPNCGEYYTQTQAGVPPVVLLCHIEVCIDDNAHVARKLVCLPLLAEVLCQCVALPDYSAENEGITRDVCK